MEGKFSRDKKEEEKLGGALDSWKIICKVGEREKGTSKEIWTFSFPDHHFPPSSSEPN